MFEVIISAVRTGRVQRKFFETREQADLFLDKFLFGKVKRFLRDYRTEVAFRADVVVRKARRPASPALEAVA